MAKNNLEVGMKCIKYMLLCITAIFVVSFMIKIVLRQKKSKFNCAIFICAVSLIYALFVHHSLNKRILLSIKFYERCYLNLELFSRKEITDQ